MISLESPPRAAEPALSFIFSNARLVLGQRFERRSYAGAATKAAMAAIDPLETLSNAIDGIESRYEVHGSFALDGLNS